MRISAARLLDTTRPLSDRGRWLRVAPFAAFAVVGLVVGWLVLPEAHPVVLLAFGLTAAIVAAAGLPWHRWPDDWQAALALTFFLVVGLIDYAAGLYYLAALPIIWLALFHTGRMMALGAGVFAVVLFLPRVVVPEAYPRPDGATLVAAFTLTLVGGAALQVLVQRTRSVAAASVRVARRARADRDLLNAYLDNAGCLVVVLDPTGRVLLFNHFAERVLGFGAEEVVGREAFGRAYHDPESRRLFQRVTSGDFPVARESDVAARSGEKRRISWSATALTDETGQVTHVIATGVDLTEQRLAERLFENVLSAAAEQMIFATDTRGVFTVFNSGGERLLGYVADELVGNATVEVMHLPEELAEAAASIGASSFLDMLGWAQPDMPTLSREWTLVRKDGSHVPVSMTIDTMTDGGEVAGFVGVARDVTAEREAAAAMTAALAREREAAERLRQLDQVKNDFVATVSHDLRTPLTSIVGNTELLLDGDAGALGLAQRRLIDAVDRNARRLNTLVGDLLLLSRIESGTLRMQLRPVAVREIVDGALEALAAKLNADVRLEVEAPAEPAFVRGDPEQLERVATNLVSNALKFTQPGGQVRVAVAVEDEQVQLSVIDTGIGIPTEELGQVFDRFFRSSRSQDKDRPGTGLGLTIAKSIVEQHDGTIEVSANPDGGTAFTVTLPRLTAAADATEMEHA